MYESLAEQATESDWSQEEKRAWYRERRDDAEYYRVQRDLLRNGLTRKAKLAHLPARQGGRPAALGDRSGWGVPPEAQKAHKMGYYGQDKRGDWARPLHVSF